MGADVGVFSTLLTTINSLATAINQLHSDLVGIQTTESSILTAADNIQTAVGSCTTAVNAVTTAVNSAITDIAAGNTTAGTINGHVSNIDTATSGLASALSALEGYASTANTGLGTLHSDNLSLNTLVTSGNSLLTTISSTLSSISSGVSTSNTDLSQLHTDLTTINTSLGTLNTDLGTANGYLSTIATNTTSEASYMATVAGAVSGGKIQTRALTAATDTVTIAASDTTPSTQTITASDAVTTSATGQGGQLIYTGTPTANSAAQYTLAGQQMVGLQLSGVASGNIYQVEVSLDATNWYLSSISQKGGNSTWPNLTANGLCSINVAGMKYLRVRCTTYVSGTATVALTESLNESAITVSAPADIVYPSVSITTTGLYLFPVPQGYQSMLLYTSGTFTSTFYFVGSPDGVITTQSGGIPTNSGYSSQATATTGAGGGYECPIPVGSKYVGLNVTTLSAGTITLTVSISARAARPYTTATQVSGSVGITSATGGILGLTGTASDGMSISTSALGITQPMLYNGNNDDRQRNNTSGTITASGAITSSAGSTAQTNYNARGVIVTLNITAYSGTSPTIALQLQMQDAAGNWVNIPGAATATISAANGSYVLALYPGIAAYSTSPGWAVNGVLPRNWRVYSTIGGSGSPSITCSLGYNYIL